jgi:TrmH family RNA methyltransferase
LINRAFIARQNTTIADPSVDCRFQIADFRLLEWLLVPPVARITSRQHPIVQRFRRLAMNRRKEPGALIDGEHLVGEALDAGVPICVVLTDGRASRLADRAQKAGATIYVATAAVLDAASPVRTASGIVAIATWQPAELRETLARAPALVIGLVDVQDPGNVGAAIRSADALGATGVAVLDRTADPGGWRALRGAMGSTFHLPVARGSTAEVLQEASRARIAVAATVAGDGEPVDAADLRRPLLVLIGNEGAGLPADVVANADLRLTVPMRDGVDSLNVAVTASLVLYEARRQRRATTGAR